MPEIILSDERYLNFAAQKSNFARANSLRIQ